MTSAVKKKQKKKKKGTNNKQPRFFFILVSKMVDVSLLIICTAHKQAGIKINCHPTEEIKTLSHEKIAKINKKLLHSLNQKILVNIPLR